jgi:hypothetical protein
MTSTAKTSIRDWLPRYWWDVRSLASALREGALTEREKFAYLFIWLWPGLVLLLLLGWEAETTDQNVWMTEAMLIGHVVLVAGVFRAYRINQAGDNRNFLERLVCLAWPVTVRAGVCLGVPNVLLLMLTDVAGRDMEIWLWLDPLFYFLLYPTIFWQLCRWMRRVSHGIPVSDPANGDAPEPR